MMFLSEKNLIILYRLIMQNFSGDMRKTQCGQKIRKARPVKDRGFMLNRGRRRAGSAEI